MDHNSNHQRFFHRCVSCNKVFPHTFAPFCECGGMIDIEYDLNYVTLRKSKNPFERFSDLLPLHSSEAFQSRNIEYTPCKSASRLGAEIGLSRLYLKNETVLPTRSTKDRMAMVSLAFLAECGVRQFCASSTGNSSSAYAQEIRRHPGLRMYLFTGEDFRDRVNYEPTDQVIPFVLRGASFVDAFNGAAQYAKENGITSERGFFNPGRREGLKMAFLEAADQVPGVIDWYVQAVSSGMGVYGTYNAAKQLHGLGMIQRLPRMRCVQQESCAPMANAFADQSEIIRDQDIVRHPTGIAEAILRGDPTRAYPHVRKIVLETGGHILSVSEKEIRAARQMLQELEDIPACFSASTAMAGIIKLANAGKLQPDETILVNITGADRPRGIKTPVVQWMEKVGDTWKA